MWLLIALAGAVFTSLTTIFAKIGIKGVSSDFATAYRTFIVMLCSLFLCLLSGDMAAIGQLTARNWVFLSLSGVATGCSWLCYYKALQWGDVRRVAPIDKSGFILTSILFLIFFFDDTTRGGNPLTIGMLFVSIALIGGGAVLMVDGKGTAQTKGRAWLPFAVLSAVFASAVSLFVKMGLQGIPSDLGTFVRTVIVLFFASAIVAGRKEYRGVREISGQCWLFLTLSGVATGGAWLCEYYALNMRGVNPVAVGAVGKLSILLTMAFTFLILKERFSRRALAGLALLTAGIAVVTVFSL